MSVLVVDVANVMGSRPDGWWRDRAGAATRLLDQLAALPGTTIEGPDGTPVSVAGVVAVVEGAAKKAAPDDGTPEGLRVVQAPGSGDDALVDEVAGLAADGTDLLVVTADRGLRARLPEEAGIAGPGWLRDRLDGMAEEATG
ncbi:hypothetical protein [Blastococcus montanus]|uniref:hypothetical protein n=1 Tax=Blastococcus montanus TaxID=3144973 RepID=UPI00320985A4